MNLAPPATLDGQQVVQLPFAASPEKQGAVDSWPHGSTGNCICIDPLETNGVLPHEVGAIPTNGGVGNTWCNAVVLDFAQPIVWKPGAIAQTNRQKCKVLLRNCDLTGGQHPVHFPPKHPPKIDTMTSFKVY